MDTPTKRWRRGYDRFDRRLSLVLDAVVGFAFEQGMAPNHSLHGRARIAAKSETLVGRAGELRIR